MEDTLKKRKDGLFYPPHAQPLKGDEGFIYSTWKFLRNPIEGFGPLAYSQPIVSVPNFGKKLHVITDPEGMMQGLALEAKKFTKTAIDARILGPATKEGLLSVHGDQWKRQRRAVAPMFAKRHMSDLAPIITEVLNGFKVKLDDKPELDLSLAKAAKGTFIYDLIYTPRMTKLLKAAKRKKLPHLGGLDMLIAQARPSFRLFYGQTPPEELDPTNILLKALEQ